MIQSFYNTAANWIIQGVGTWPKTQGQLYVLTTCRENSYCLFLAILGICEFFTTPTSIVHRPRPFSHITGTK